MKTTAKEASKAALAYFEDIFQAKYDNVAVEEIELLEDSTLWLVTIGYQLPETSLLLIPNSSPRQYKVFQVSADTADVKSMKIRKVN